MFWRRSNTLGSSMVSQDPFNLSNDAKSGGDPQLMDSLLEAEKAANTSVLGGTQI